LGKKIITGFAVFACLIASTFAVGSPDDIEQKKFRTYELINSNYINSIKPIFARACFDCHSSHTQFPWYHSLPLIKKLLDDDIREGRKHIDMSEDFPFDGHGSAEEDLRAIKKSTDNGSMPPLKYWIIHFGTKLNKSEKELITNWIDESLNKLEGK
jgi:hypothetical protein